jgi:magnesium chelatase family protein
MWATKYRSGEIGMAAHGVLFLDEIDQFSSAVIRHTADHIAQMRCDYTAPLIVASAGPCPCGWMNYKEPICKCSDQLILRYRSRLKEYCDELSIDTIIKVPMVTVQAMQEAAASADFKANQA